MGVAEARPHSAVGGVAAGAALLKVLEITTAEFLPQVLITLLTQLPTTALFNYSPNDLAQLLTKLLNSLAYLAALFH